MSATSSKRVNGTPVWCVLLTDYTDSYSHNGNWSANRGPEVFSTKEKADAYLRHELLKELYDRVWDDPARKSPVFDRWYQVNGEWRLKDENDLDVIESELEPYITGEFVPVRLDWEVFELVLDEECVEEEKHETKKVKTV